VKAEGGRGGREQVQFETVASVEVVRHRGFHHWKKRRHQTIQVCWKVRRKLDACRTTYSNGLTHQLVEESAHVLVIADYAEGLARACRDARGAREQYELFPDIEKDMIRQRDINVRSLYLLYVTREDIIRMPVRGATAVSGIGPGGGDRAGPGDGRENVVCPADHGFIPKDRHESLDAVDAVLKSNHTGVGAYEWARLLTCRFGIPQLNGE